MQGFVMGAITGAIGAGVNTFVSSAWGSTLGTFGTKVVSGAIAGGIMGELSGEGFREGAIFGAVTGAVTWGVQKWFGNSLDKWAGEEPRKIAFANSIKRMAVAVVTGQDPVEAAGYGAVYSVGSSVGEKIANKITGKVEVEVLIYDNGTSDSHFYGHADIAIGDTVYAYGRFDPDATWGIPGIRENGDGVLKVSNKQEWIQRALKEGTKVYGYKLNVSPAEAQKIEQFFKSEISNNGKFWDVDKYGCKMYKFTGKYQTYHAFGGPNCATLTMDALKTAVGDRMNWSLKNAVTPAMVKKGLDAYVVPFSDLIYGNNKLVSEKVYYK